MRLAESGEAMRMCLAVPDPDSGRILRDALAKEVTLNANSWSGTAIYSTPHENSRWLPISNAGDCKHKHKSVPLYQGCSSGGVLHTRVALLRDWERCKPGCGNLSLQRRKREREGRKGPWRSKD